MRANLPAMREPIASWAPRHAERVGQTIDDPDDRAVFEGSYARLWPALV